MQLSIDPLQRYYKRGVFNNLAISTSIYIMFWAIKNINGKMINERVKVVCLAWPCDIFRQ